MRIALVTQEDPFYLPAALDSICASRSGDVCALIVLPAFNEGLFSTARRLYELYGLRDFSRLVTRYGLAKIADRVNRAWPITSPRSAADVARRHSVPLFRPADICAREFLEVLRSEIRPDLLVSVAASQIFRRRLLELPPLGCINLHSAALPRYRGMMPNFWTLLHGEREAAVSVHYMVDEIDAGDIIVQRPVPIRDADSLHDLMVRSKRVGVEALLEAVRQIEKGTVRRRPAEKDQATYFSFPTRSDGQRLRSMGRRLL